MPKKDNSSNGNKTGLNNNSNNLLEFKSDNNSNKRKLKQIVKSLILKARKHSLENKPRVVINLQVYTPSGYDAVRVVQKEQLYY